MTNEELERTYFWLSFPRKTNWRYTKTTITNRKLRPGEVVQILDLREDGWLAYGVGLSDCPLLSWRVKLYSPQGQLLDLYGSPQLAYEFGATQAHSGCGFWLARYDTTEKRFVMFATPSWPGLAFSQRLEFILKNESSEEATMLSLEIVRITLLEA